MPIEVLLSIIASSVSIISAVVGGIAFSKARRVEGIVKVNRVNGNSNTQVVGNRNSVGR